MQVPEPPRPTRFDALRRWLLLGWALGCGLLYVRTVLDARLPEWHHLIPGLRP
jgi:hypothetical protein